MHDITFVFPSSTGIFTPVQPPGAGGNNPIVMGTQGNESFTDLIDLQWFSWATNLNLGCLNAFSDIQAFFGEYRFESVEAEFQFLAGDSYAPSIGSPLPELHVFSDPRDSVPPSSIILADTYQDQERRVMQPARPYVISYVPKVAAQVFLSGVATSYAEPQKRAMWLSTQDLNTPHYGLKGLFRNWPGAVGVAQGCMVRVSFTAYISLRRPQ